MKLEKQILGHILETGLLPNGAKVICALSGGADSTALLRILHALRDPLSLTLCAAHVNHGIRGAQADEDEDFCRNLCESLSVPFYAAKYDVPALAAETGESVELRARKVRLSFFAEVAEKTGADYVAMAHNAGDALETSVYNLARGTGLYGIAGIPAVSAMEKYTVVRPLLRTSREQIEDYLRAIGQPFRTDGSNLEDEYTRNRIRHRVIPELLAVNPGLMESSAHTLSLLSAEADFLRQEAEKACAAMIQAGSVEVDALFSLHPALRGRVLETLYREAAGRNAPQPEYRHIEDMLALCRAENPSARIDLPSGVWARREYGRLIVEKKPTETEPGGDIELVPGTEVLFAGRFLVRLETGEGRPADVKKLHNLFVDCSKIYGKLSIGTRRQGEKIRLAGHDGSVTLKKIMIDRKIPRDLRDRLPVVRDEKGVVACARIGVDARAAIDEDTRRFYKITIEEK